MFLFLLLLSFFRFFLLVGLLLIACNMIDVTAGVKAQLLVKLKFCHAVMAGCREGGSMDFFCVDLVELRDLIMDDHFVGKQVDVCVLRICD